MTLQRHKTDAFFAGIDDRVVLNIFIGFVKVARAITTELMAESPLQNTGPLTPHVAMRRNLGTGCGLEHKHACTFVLRHFDVAQVNSAAYSSPRAEPIRRKWRGHLR